MILKLYPSSGIPHTFRAYNIKTHTLIGDFLSGGRGAREVINPSVIPPLYKKNDELYMFVKDFPTYNFIQPGKPNFLYESDAVYSLGDHKHTAA